MPKPPIVLDLCGGTGSWSRPYVEKGYRVLVATLPKYDVTKVVFEPEHIVFLGQTPDAPDVRVRCRSVRGILAAPPCTNFSLVKATVLSSELRDGLVAVRACQDIIWHIAALGHLKWWAMENPVGRLRRFLGVPKFQFEQWQYGEPAIKRTDLWGWFTAPTPIVTVRPHIPLAVTSRRTVTYQNARPPVGFKMPKGGLSQGAIRAITPPGFAAAFAKANK